ncbi:HNH endonuclease [Microbacterium sp. p3-SID338]|uniref:HNH endonuclease n=1 Tax=Microbacterium sp. p3-SID338 TaxID=2916214 RepID=UPI0021A36F5E|nr:HNH endonuclease [Microbacterium sp. p3-SID338]MCT1395647.1 HNH endonuclease [Microbacterium sp. p3-SID338]
MSILEGVDRAEVQARIDRSDASGCWPWTGGSSSNGYGYVSRGRQRSKVLAHRVVFTIEHGPIAPGMQIDHTCHTEAVAAGECNGGDDCPHRACVNPSHLEAVTPRTNTLRGLSPAAAHSAQTECIHHHPFTDENTYRTPNGKRACRACARINDQRRPSGWQRQRKSAERTAAA